MRNRRISPNDESASKAQVLAVRETSKNWSIHHWKPALQSFQMRSDQERVSLSALR